MLKQFFALTLVLTLVSVLALPAVVAAQIQSVDVQDVPASPIDTQEELIGLVALVADWIFTIFLIVAVIFILLAAWQFVTAGGNSTAVGEARMKIMYAAIGILVALGAQAIPAVVANILGVSIEGI